MEFNYYDILRSERDETTGTITAQLGDAVSGQRITDDAEVWQHVGFASRPSEVVSDKPTDAAQSISLSRTDGDIVFATRDVRGQEIYGSLNPGDTCVYASGPEGAGQARIYLQGDNSNINLFTRKDADADGMGIFIDPQEDTIRITNAAGNGILIGPDDVKIFTSSSLVHLSDTIKMGGSGSTYIGGSNVTIGDTKTNTVGLSATSKIDISGAGLSGLPVARVSDQVVAGPFGGTIVSSTNIKATG